MKRLLLLSVFVVVVLGVAAAPALAWYNPKLNTAYVTTFTSGWDQWNGPSDPLNATHHTGAIPHGWSVVLGMTWGDSETGAKLAPIEFLHTFSLHKVNGTWSRKITDPVRTVRFWSPAYEWDSVGSPGIWASDWWVPLGKLAKGTYKGWAREQVLSTFPTWTDDTGALVTDPIWLPAYNTKWSHTFRVK
jgi:hypothetical protein